MKLDFVSYQCKMSQGPCITRPPPLFPVVGGMAKTSGKKGCWDACLGENALCIAQLAWQEETELLLPRGPTELDKRHVTGDH